MLRRGYSDFINFILPPKLSPNMQRNLIPIAHHDKGGAGQIHITYSYALQFPGKGRRILCRLLGGWVEEGLYPANKDTLGGIVRDISYNNAVRYFGL